MSESRYDIVYRNGIALDRWTAQLWDKLVAKFPHLILTQGVRSGAQASAGTHLGLGVLDLYLGGHAWRDVLKYAFQIGFFGWYRPELWQNGRRVWKSHCHLGVRGHPKMADSLKAQQVSWTNGRNGLRGNGDDFFDYRPSNYKQDAPYGPPAERWYSVAFLNMHGDDGGTGTRTFHDRLPRMVTDLTYQLPSVIAVCEVRTSQLPDLTDRLEAKGYKFVRHASRMALFVRESVGVKASSFYQFKKQNGGALEGILYARLQVKGSWTHVGVVHLDYRDNFDTGRVETMKEGIGAMSRFATRWVLPKWKTRTVIAGDFNSHAWVMDKAVEPAGFVDTGCGADIDFIVTGEGRPVLYSSHARTNSDHPKLRATFGRYV